MGRPGNNALNPEEVDKTFFIDMGKRIWDMLEQQFPLESLGYRKPGNNSSLISQIQKVKKERALLLAMLLADIHAYNLSPFYEDSTSPLWETLEEKAINRKDVDKAFFKRIARKILSRIENS